MKAIAILPCRLLDPFWPGESQTPRVPASRHFAGLLQRASEDRGARVHRRSRNNPGKKRERTVPSSPGSSDSRQARARLWGTFFSPSARRLAVPPGSPACPVACERHRHFWSVSWGVQFASQNGSV